MLEKSEWKRPAAILGIFGLLCTVVGLYLSHRPQKNGKTPSPMIIVNQPQPTAVDIKNEKRTNELQNKIHIMDSLIQKWNDQMNKLEADAYVLYAISDSEEQKLPIQKLRKLVNNRKEYHLEKKVLDDALQECQEKRDRYQAQLDAISN